jgi:hypothetical protein
MSIQENKKKMTKVYLRPDPIKGVRVEGIMSKDLRLDQPKVFCFYPGNGSKFEVLMVDLHSSVHGLEDRPYLWIAVIGHGAYYFEQPAHPGYVFEKLIKNLSDATAFATLINHVLENQEEPYVPEGFDASRN